MKKITELSGVMDFPGLKKLFRIMKLTTFLILLSVVCALANSAYSQTKKLNLSMKNATVKEVLSAIEDQSEFKFMYSGKLIDVERQVAINEENSKIEDALKSLFAGTDVNYTIRDRIIVLSSTANSEPQSSQQQKPVSGKVTDSTGSPLPGVSVVVKGTTTGTITDANGNYTLLNVPENATLQFSFVGMKAQEVVVAGKSTVNVKMEEDTVGVDEVVVVGYGTQKQVNLTGSISSIKEKQLSGRTVDKISDALQGQMAGVTVINSNGRPGSGSTVRIRGIGTMNNSAPMVLVDGIEASMDDVNPEDIERIDVLKDAASSAIYGTRAANGVILITTKRGSIGTVKVSLNSYFAKQLPTSLPDFLGSYEYANMYNQGLVNEGKQPVYKESDLEKYKNGSDPYLYPNTDWYDLILQGSGLQHFHSLKLAGGTDISKFMLSMGFLDQDGLVDNNNYKRYNLRFNLDSKISERFSILLNSHLVRESDYEPMGRYGQGLSQIFIETYRNPPTVPVKNSNGEWGHYLGNNPVAWIEDFGGGKRQLDRTRATIVISPELEIIKGLKVKGIISADFSLEDRKTHIKTISYEGGIVQGPNSITSNLQRRSNITLQTFLSYDGSFNSHNFKGLLGVDRESFSYDYTEAYRKDLPSNLLDEINAGSTNGQIGSGNGSDSRLGSYFGRINYNFKEKYLLEFNLRRDGSSKFASNKRWGLFPSVSAGWRVFEESFLKNLSFLTQMKLFSSYGILGNHQMSEYMYLPKISLGSKYPLNGSIINGAYIANATNPDLTWEESKEFNIGMDLSFFDGKLNLRPEYYKRYTDKILTTVPVAFEFGLNSPVQNIGAMSNRGFEFLVNHSSNINKRFSYDISFNFSLNKNITERWPIESKGNNIKKEGIAWNSYYGYEWAGFFQTDEEVLNSAKILGTKVIKGDLKYKDQNGDIVINADDRVVLGNSFPGKTFGLNISAKYSNIDFSLLLNGVGDISGASPIGAIMPFFNGGKVKSIHRDSWTPNNPNSEFPVIRIDQGINQVFSSFYVRDASYLRLKNIQLGYNFPKIKYISKIRVYLTAENLITLTSYWKDIDPETINAESDYPQVKTFTAGINIDF